MYKAHGRSCSDVVQEVRDEDRAGNVWCTATVPDGAWNRVLESRRQEVESLKGECQDLESWHNAEMSKLDVDLDFVLEDYVPEIVKKFDGAPRMVF